MIKRKSRKKKVNKYKGQISQVIWREQVAEQSEREKKVRMKTMKENKKEYGKKEKINAEKKRKNGGKVVRNTGREKRKDSERRNNE